MEKELKNFTVYAVGDNGATIALAAFPISEPALALSLEIHRVLNLPHKIKVVDSDGVTFVELVGKASIVPDNGKSEK